MCCHLILKSAWRPPCKLHRWTQKGSEKCFGMWKSKFLISFPKRKQILPVNSGPGPTCCLAAVWDMGGYNPDAKSSTRGLMEFNLSARASNSLISLSLVVEPCVLIQTVIFFKPFLATYINNTIVLRKDYIVCYFQPYILRYGKQKLKANL